MTVQWFPGHMNKARREIKDSLASVDVVIEILDARIPHSSQNPLLARLRGTKPCIRVLNKSDLADPILTCRWQEHLEQEQGVKTLALTMDQPEKIRQLAALCRKLAGSNNTPDDTVKALIMGIPNVGKSTLINILAGRTIAKTGDEPAVTKRQQRIAIGNNVVLLDTPGMLWPKIENPKSGYRLAATGAVKDTALSHEEVVVFLVAYLSDAYPENIKSRYKLESLPQASEELLRLVGAKRGCLRVGGMVEMDKAAKIILTELRSGLLGKVTLETPEMISQELQELTLEKELEANVKKAQ